tara:strand:- start:5825 stop:8509 length:2685 start_codon:yes stop_codon:yes gene_type:complete
MSDEQPIDKESVDLAQKLKQALFGTQKEMKELYSMGRLYASTIGDSEEIIKRSNFIRGQELGLVTALSKQSANNNRTQKIAHDIAATTNDIIDSRNRTMADLLLKQTMLQTGLSGEHAEQAKNLALLLQSGEITEGIYNMHVKRLQEDQKHNNKLKEELELQESIAESILEIQEEADAWKKSFTKIFETAKAIGRDPAILGAFMMKEGIEKLEKAHESFETLRESGLSSGQAIEAQFKGLSISSMLGLSDTKGVMEGVVQEFGNVNALSSETVNELGTMAHHLGISGQEALKLNASLSQLPGETSETAAAAMEHTAHLAEAQGIAGSKVFKDMAANAGTMALYSKGGAEGFGKAAVELHKMGVEIATASKMADGLLNFEDSINKQMEASVLLGREINLDKARELALSGDLAGSTAEVLKNIGGSAEFEKMNVMQKKALAEATGMSVEELQKSIDAQEESNKYFGEGSSLADNALGAMMEYGGKAAGFFKENGELILASTQFLMDGNLKKAAGYAMDAAHWVKEKAHMLWVKAQSALGMGGGAAKAGAGALGKGADLASKATEGAAGAAEKASAIKPGKGGIADTFKDVAKGLKEFANGKVVLGALALIPIGIGLAAMLVGIPTIFLLAIPGIGLGFSMNMKAIGKGLSSLGQAASNPYTWLGIALLAAFGAALIPLTFALSLLAPVIEAFGTVITAVFEGMAVLIGAIADAFVKVFQVFADNWQILIPVGIGLQILGVGLLSLGVASYFAFPGLMLAAAGLALMIPGLTIVNQIAQMNALGSLAESLSALGSAGPGLALVGASLVGIAGGLSLMALSGLMALPIIGALIGLAAVAPALSGLMGGGGKGEEDKMQVIADKLDQLIAVASKGGEINMDGRKVGEIVRLGLNTSNVR